MREKTYEIEVSAENWVKLPVGLTKNVKAIERTIKALEIIKKINQGKYVESTNGLSNKIKHYLLGYMTIMDYLDTPIKVKL